MSAKELLIGIGQAIVLGVMIVVTWSMFALLAP